MTENNQQPTQPMQSTGMPAYQQNAAPQQAVPQPQYQQTAQTQPINPAVAAQQQTPSEQNHAPQLQQPQFPGQQRQPVQPGNPVQPQPQQGVHFVQQAGNGKNYNGFAVAGLVLGLLAVTVALWQVSDYVNPFGVIGLALAIIGYASTSQPDADGTIPQAQRVGRIFSIAGIVLAVVAILVTFLIGITGWGNTDYSSMMY